jgi:tellurite resistance protein TerC
MFKGAVGSTYKLARRIAVAIVGSTVLAVGVALIVLPGPAIVVIPIGLAILSLEFAWARMWLKRVRRSISSQSAESRADRAEEHRQRTSR